MYTVAFLLWGGVVIVNAVFSQQYKIVAKRVVVTKQIQLQAQ
jgi:hypothetical protein